MSSKVEIYLIKEKNIFTQIHALFAINFPPIPNFFILLDIYRLNNYKQTKMASHYKIKKSKLKEFFGLFTKKRTPQKLQKMIDNDPVLQKLKADVDRLNYKYKPEIDKLKDERPEMFKMFQNWGLIPNDYN